MQIPLDGSRTVFVNEGNGEIYTKMLSMEDGSIRFETYVRRQEPEGCKEDAGEMLRAMEGRVAAIERALKTGAADEKAEGQKA